MKSKQLINTTIAFLLAIGFNQSAFAQALDKVQAEMRPLNSDFPYSANELNNQMQSKGTNELQKRILLNINNSLRNGAITAAEAAEWKVQLNQLNLTESWYRSYNKPIPQSVLDENVRALKTIDNKLAHNPKVSSNTESTLHSDIHDLIADALSKNRITSSQAARYYMRLAQDESNLESIKLSENNGSQVASIEKDLSNLRLELQH